MQLKNGSAVSSYLGEFVWAIETEKSPSIIIDDKPAAAMRSLPGHIWVLTAQLATGRSHAHYYRGVDTAVDEKRFDKAAYTEDSYPQPRVARGKLSEQLVNTSKVYEGHEISYWIYAAPGVDPVVSWLAMFSAMIRSRVVCASIPRAAMPSALSRSMTMSCLSR